MSPDQASKCRIGLQQKNNRRHETWVLQILLIIRQIWIIFHLPYRDHMQSQQKTG